MRCHRLLLALLLTPGFAVLHTPLGQACAVPTVVRVANEGAVPIRSVYVSGPSAGPNQLPAAGLAPGEAAAIVLPSCIGRYDISVVFADGRTTVHPALNAATIRGLPLR